MSLHLSELRFGAVLLGALSVVGCASALTEPAAAVQFGEPVSSVDDSMLCQGVADHFIGLPAMTPTSPAEAPTDAQAGAATAGRWWVRKCSARSHGAELSVRLEGPGWYWVDQASSGIRVTQQVPFELSISLTGHLHEAIEGGVLSIWLRPGGAPEIEVRSPAVLQVKSENAWGDLLSVVPGVSPEKRAAQRFNAALTQAFRRQLRGGATFTYDVRAGQSDATLGSLAPGKTPPHPFDDEPDWVVNDRLLLPPGASQVLGPIAPGASHVNVIVERGPGITYRAICQKDLQESYSMIAGGALANVPTRAWAFIGTMAGMGERTATLRIEGCKFYLVASTLGGVPTLADVRVRT